MYKVIFIILVMVMVGCSGKDIQDVDTIPPLKPHLIPHQGDTGDVIETFPGHADTINYYNNSDVENNGIDADPGGDYINVQWEHILDSDIDFLEIYRFNLLDYQNEIPATKIDSISSPNKDEYLDEFSDVDTPISVNWFYYVRAVDTSGNSTISDTTCYRIVNKAYLVSPPNFANFDDIHDITFQWNEDISGEVSSYRLILLDEDYNLIWSYEPASNEELEIPYTGPSINNQSIRWRVDFIGHTLEDQNINGKLYTIFSGSESNERVITVQ